VTDMVHQPEHYTTRYDFECIEATRHMTFCTGNAFKYIYRCHDKGTYEQDLRKALVYAAWAWQWQEPAAYTAAGTAALGVIQATYLAPYRRTDVFASLLANIIEGANWEIVIPTLEFLVYGDDQ
jgi:hypothetical protein